MEGLPVRLVSMFTATDFVAAHTLGRNSETDKDDLLPSFVSIICRRVERTCARLCKS